MSAAMWLSLLAGLLAGAIEGQLLRRAATRPTLLGLPLRLALVGGVLFGAALLGGLLAAVVGWVIALALSVGVVAWRWT